MGIGLDAFAEALTSFRQGTQQVKDERKAQERFNLDKEARANDIERGSLQIDQLRQQIMDNEEDAPGRKASKALALRRDAAQTRRIEFGATDKALSQDARVRELSLYNEELKAKANKLNQDILKSNNSFVNRLTRQELANLKLEQEKANLEYIKAKTKNEEAKQAVDPLNKLLPEALKLKQKNVTTEVNFLTEQGKYKEADKVIQDYKAELEKYKTGLTTGITQAPQANTVGGSLDQLRLLQADIQRKRSGGKLPPTSNKANTDTQDGVSFGAVNTGSTGVNALPETATPTPTGKNKPTMDDISKILNPKEVNEENDISAPLKSFRVSEKIRKGPSPLHAKLIEDIIIPQSTGRIRYVPKARESGVIESDRLISEKLKKGFGEKGAAEIYYKIFHTKNPQQILDTYRKFLSPLEINHLIQQTKKK
jgi:hypothetical protein